mgnify:FL=1|jgi:acyl-coenzyme A thioesterase PaaI-like protein|tara:strand:+ start:910 stop:1110 length:201 start_codon:yes stop_codon:yes gene_type:complete
MTPFPRGRCASVEFNVNFLNAVGAATSGFSVEVIKRGKSMDFAQAEITHSNRLVSRATGTWTIRAK